MSPDSNDPNLSPLGESDLGLPAVELGELEQEPTIDLVPIVRRKIYRRTAASQFVNFSWGVPAMLIREFLILAADLFKGSKTNPQ